MPEPTPRAALVDLIRSRLTSAFAPLRLDIADESAAHVGHAGAQGGGGHYRVHLVSERFTGLTRVERHRLVYDSLQDLMQRDVHALALSLLTPVEAGGNSAESTTGTQGQ